MNSPNNHPLISIILPCYNGEEYLQKAIESCLSQTMENFELIIVDDGSTDNSLSIAKSYENKDIRLKIIVNTVNKKLPASLNIGHDAARGDYFTWTSHDNLLHRNFLEKLLDGIKCSDSDIAFSDYLVIQKDGSVKRKNVSGPVDHLLFGNFIGPSFLYKKEVYFALKGYNTDLFLVEDYDFWLRASLYFRFFHVNEVLYSYRLQPNSLTSGIQKKIENDKKHKEGRYAMVKATAEHLNWNNKTTELITTILLGRECSFDLYFDNKAVIEKDIEKYCGKFLKPQKAKAALSAVVRSYLQSSDKEKKPSTLFKIIRKDRRILCQNHFSKIETIKLVYKCLRSR